ISSEAKEGTNHILSAQFAHEGSILHLALSSDGKTLVSTADDKTVKVWDVSGNPVERHVLPPQSDWPAAVSFVLDDSALLVGRLDGSVGWYDAKSGTELAPPKPEL